MYSLTLRQANRITEKRLNKCNIVMLGFQTNLATAITIAPQTFPICTAEIPTPPAAPRTSSTYNFPYFFGVNHLKDIMLVLFVWQTSYNC